MGIAGLLQWSVYHRISRRNDGLMFVIVGGLPFNRGDEPPIISMLIRAMLAVIMGGLFGVISPQAIGPNRGVGPEADPFEMARGEDAGGSGPDDSRA